MSGDTGVEADMIQIQCNPGDERPVLCILSSNPFAGVTSGWCGMRVWGKGTSDYKTRKEQEMQVILGGSGLTESGIHVFFARFAKGRNEGEGVGGVLE